MSENNKEFFYNKMNPDDVKALTQLDTLYELLSFASVKFENSEALCDKKNGTPRVLTYRQLFTECESLAAYLDSQPDAGNRIAVIGNPCIEWVKAFFGIVCSGRTAVLIPQSLPAEAISGILNLSKTTGIICGEEYADKLRSAAGNKSFSLFLTFSELDGLTPATQSTGRKISAGDTAALFFTTGTTGQSKCVPLTHKNIMANAYNGILGVPIHRGDRCLAVLPFFHVFGLVRSVISFLYEGGTVYINKDIKTFVPNLQWARPTTLILVPSLAETLALLVEKCGVAVLGSELLTIITGGSAMKPKTKQQFAKYGINLLQGYGLTEASMICGNTDTEKCFSSVGKVYPGCEVKTENGELLIRGENVFSGYSDPSLNAEVFRDGWFCTGDLGYIDEEGYVYITGRKKFLIITANGENVSPEELEALLDGNGRIEESLVYEGRNERSDAVIAADIYAPGLTTDECRDIINEINRGLPNFKRIQSFKLTDAPLARNAGNKLIRKTV